MDFGHSLARSCIAIAAMQLAGAAFSQPAAPGGTADSSNPIRFEVHPVAQLGKQTWGTALNSKGEVTGIWTDSEGNRHGFATGTDGAGITSNDLCPPGTDCAPQGMNEHGLIVGNYHPVADMPYEGFVVKADGSGFHQLPATQRHGKTAQSEAEGINDFGKIVGWSSVAGSGTHTTITGLGKHGAQDQIQAVPGADSVGYAINDEGVVVGQIVSNAEPHQAFVLTSETSDKMIRLGTLGGATSSALAVASSENTVVGMSDTADGSTHAFYAQVFPSGHTMVDIGTIGGGSSNAYGVNIFGHVVGTGTDATGTTYPFIYDIHSGRLRDLNEFIKDPTAPHIDYALAINDSDEILVVAGKWSYLLVPAATTP